MTFLAGDIGGTKTHLALFDSQKKRIKEQKYPSRKFTNLKEIIHQFLEGWEKEIQGACLGIAGPVREGKCIATNLPWIVDEKNLELKKVKLINDLEANAYGISQLSSEDFAVLNQGKEVKGHQALISAGTGLGEAGLFFNGSLHIPFASEGGHSDFSPRNEREISLLRFLQKKWEGHVSFERVLSGPGLYNLYQYLVEIEKKEPDPDVERLSEAEAPQEISKKGVGSKEGTCFETLSWFVSLYGAESGNLVLKYLSLGGLYVGGGIAPKILSLMKEGGFLKSFLDKGRFSDLLKEVSIKVILNEETALLGAAFVAHLQKK
ncbi:MAG: glucokinase [Simkaniaceae bacterium]